MKRNSLLEKTGGTQSKRLTKTRRGAVVNIKTRCYSVLLIIKYFVKCFGGFFGIEPDIAICVLH